jgi:hypothetical protein
VTTHAKDSLTMFYQSITRLPCLGRRAYPQEIVRSSRVPTSPMGRSIAEHGLQHPIAACRGILARQESTVVTYGNSRGRRRRNRRWSPFLGSTALIDACHSERSEESGRKETLRFAQGDRHRPSATETNESWVANDRLAAWWAASSLALSVSTIRFHRQTRDEYISRQHCHPRCRYGWYLIQDRIVKDRRAAVEAAYATLSWLDVRSTATIGYLGINGYSNRCCRGSGSGQFVPCSHTRCRGAGRSPAMVARP